MNVLGDQKLAEEWLGRSCKYLEGYVPLDIIDNAMRLSALLEYVKCID